jgi:hypothetical protein
MYSVLKIHESVGMLIFNYTPLSHHLVLVPYFFPVTPVVSPPKSTKLFVKSTPETQLPISNCYNHVCYLQDGRS